MFARQLLRDTGLTGLLQLTRLLGGLLLLPVLLRAMGPETYGLVALGVSICTYSVMLESVLTPALRNQLNLALARGEAQQLAALQRVAFTAAVLVLISLVVLIGLLALAWLDVAARPFLGLALACVSAIALAALGGVVDCLFSALDALWLLRAWELAGTVVGFACAAVWARDQRDPALVLSALVLAPHIPKLWAWYRQVRSGTLDARFDWRALRMFAAEHARDSRQYLLLQLTLCLLSTFPTLFVTHQLGLAATTLWSTAQRVIAAPSNFLVALIPLAWPRITRAHAAGHMSILRQVFWIGLVVLAALMSVWTAVAAWWKGPLFDLLTAGTVAPPVALLVAMGALVVANTCSAWVSGFLNAFGEFGSQMRQALWTLALTLVLAPLGLHALGLPGMIVAILFALLACGLVPAAVKAQRRLQTEAA